MAFLQAESLSFSYPDSARPALDGISFKVEPGEYIAILGANGSGKSTLARHFNGLLTASSGSLLVDGRDPRDARALPDVRRAVSLVFQSPNDQIVGTVAEFDIAFGPENLGLSRTEIARRVDSCLQATGLEDERFSPVQLLSPGKQQSLALADSLAMESPCLVLDEASSMIQPESRNALLDALDALHRSGKTIVHVTHSMEEAARSDRVLVLSRGALAFDGSPEALFAHGALSEWGLAIPESLLLKTLLAPFWELSPEEGGPPDRHPSPADFSERIGRRLSSCARLDPPAARKPRPRKIALSLDNVSFSYSAANGSRRAALKDVSLKVGSGEIVAFVGPSGAGKSTALQLANALFLPESGRVHCLGLDSLAPRLDTAALRRRAALCLQRADAALFEPFAADDVAYGPRLCGLSGRALFTRVRDAMETMGLPYQKFRDAHPRSLSGGERRRLAIAGVLALDAELYLFDEPTSSLDPGAKAHALELLKELKAKGKTVVFTTHSMEEAAIADRAIVFKDGRIAFDGSPENLFYQRNPEAWGLDRPFAVKVTENLPPEVRHAIGKPLTPAALALRVKKLAGIAGTDEEAQARPSQAQAGERIAEEPEWLMPKPRRGKGQKANLFDIRSRIAVGQFVDADSFFHRLSPRMKFLALFAILVPTFLSRNPWAPLACLALCLCACATARIRVYYVFRGILPALPFFGLYLILLFFFGSSFDRSRPLLRLWKFALTLGELKDLASLLLKLLSFMGAFGLFSSITSMSQVVHGIEDLLKPLSRVGIRASRMGMIVGISFRYLPILAEEAENILKAQASRGSPGYTGGYARRVRTAVSLFVPLIVRSLERAEILSDAMQARCYPGNAPSRYKEYPRHRHRILVFSLTLICGLSLSALAVLVR